MTQTSIQEENAIRLGSLRVLIGADASSLVDIGTIRSGVFNNLSENQEVAFDNAPSLRKFVNGNKASLACEIQEINLTNIAVMDGGLLTLDTVAGTLVSGESQAVASGAWAYEKFIALENQNGDGSKPTINSVTGGTDGALTVNDDYFVTQVGNQWGIVVRDGTNTTTENQSITVDYDYTPNASKRITFNETGTKNTFYMRLINTDADGNRLMFDLERVTNTTPISLPFASDAEAEVASLPVTLEGYVVSNGWVDEQQTT